MVAYWSSRLADALARSRTAPTERVRVVHLSAAAHYQALLGLELSRHSAKGDRLAA